MPNQTQEQYVHLVRLAWDLRWAGLAVSVELPRAGEPFVEVPRAGGPLHVRATLRSGQWIFTWGRGRDHWTYALGHNAASQIEELTR